MFATASANRISLFHQRTAMIVEIAPDAPYQLLLDRAARCQQQIEQFCLGLTWSYCRAGSSLGLAMSPGLPSRTLDWPGTVAGRTVAEVAPWLRQWNPFAATLGLAAVNAAINGSDNTLLQQAEPLTGAASANLAVFEHFLPRLQQQKVVVIGRYPGLDRLLQGLDVTVLERLPGESDLPDTAAEFLLPQADWVFLTATSLINKSFARLATLARDAVTVLMGPSTPWLVEWADFHVDFVAGVQVVDAEHATRIAMEGGGVRLFSGGVGYAVADIGAGKLDLLKRQIAHCAERRLQLRAAMEAWYAAGNTRRFAQFDELAQAERELSRLDTLFKRQWDARQR